MIGLYILTTKLLEKDKTIKFGMSMRIEYRWIDYLIIFNDSKYIYYYEFIDNLSREEIFSIEQEIIELYKYKRNYFFQTEYFYCDNYDELNEIIITVLDNKKINYNIYNIHNFDKKYYDNKPEPLNNSFNREYYSNNIIPYDFQQDILNNIEYYYKYNNIGKIIYCLIILIIYYMLAVNQI